MYSHAGSRGCFGKLAVFLVAFVALFCACNAQTCKPPPFWTPSFSKNYYTSLLSNWSETDTASSQGGALFTKIGNLQTAPSIAGKGTLYGADLVDMGEGGNGLMITPAIESSASGTLVCLWVYNLSLSSSGNVVAKLLESSDHSFYVEMRSSIDGDSNDDDDEGSDGEGIKMAVVSVGDGVQRHQFLKVNGNSTLSSTPMKLYAGTPEWKQICVSIPGMETDSFWRLYVNATLVGAISGDGGPGSLPEGGLDKIMIQGTIPLATMIDEISIYNWHVNPQYTLAFEFFQNDFLHVRNCKYTQTNPTGIVLLDQCMADSFPRPGLSMSCDFSAGQSCVWWGPAVYSPVNDYPTGEWDLIEDGLSLSGMKLTTGFVEFPVRSGNLFLQSGATFSVWVRQVLNVSRGLFFVNGTANTSVAVGTFPASLEDEPDGDLWIHLAVVVDSESAMSYVNGVQVATQATTGAGWWPLKPLQSLGGNSQRQSLDESGFALYYDELLFFNRTLFPSEIYNLAKVTDCLRYLDPTTNTFIVYEKEAGFDPTRVAPVEENGYYADGLRVIQCPEDTWRLDDSLICLACPMGTFTSDSYSGCNTDCNRSLEPTEYDGENPVRMSCRLPSTGNSFDPTATTVPEPLCFRTDGFQNDVELVCNESAGCVFEPTLSPCYLDIWYVSIWFSGASAVTGEAPKPIFFGANGTILLAAINETLWIYEDNEPDNPVYPLPNSTTDWTMLTLAARFLVNELGVDLGYKLDVYLNASIVSYSILSVNGFGEIFLSQINTLFASSVDRFTHAEAAPLLSYLFSEHKCIRYGSPANGRIRVSRQGCTTTLQLTASDYAETVPGAAPYSVVYVLWPPNTIGKVDAGTLLATHNQFAIMEADTNDKVVLEIKKETRVVALWQYKDGDQTTFHCFGSGLSVPLDLTNFDMYTTCPNGATANIAITQSCDTDTVGMFVGLGFAVVLCGIAIYYIVDVLRIKYTMTSAGYTMMSLQSVNR